MSLLLYRNNQSEMLLLAFPMVIVQFLAVTSSESDEDYVILPRQIVGASSILFAYMWAFLRLPWGLRYVALCNYSAYDTLLHCMYVCMYVCMDVCTYIASLYVCMYIASLYVCMYVHTLLHCMYVCIYIHCFTVCMYVHTLLHCMYVYTYIASLYVCIYIHCFTVCISRWLLTSVC